LKFTLVASNLVQPTSVVHAGDGSGRLFITQQSGQILTLTGTTLDAIPFLDIASKIKSGGEQGLLCVAFPPDYVNKRHFYLNYMGCCRKPNVPAFFLFKFGLVGFCDKHPERFSGHNLCRIDRRDKRNPQFLLPTERLAALIIAGRVTRGGSKIESK